MINIEPSPSAPANTQRLLTVPGNDPCVLLHAFSRSVFVFMLLVKFGRVLDLAGDSNGSIIQCDIRAISQRQKFHAIFNLSGI